METLPLNINYFIFTDTQTKKAEISWRKAKWQCVVEQNDHQLDKEQNIQIEL